MQIFSPGNPDDERFSNRNQLRVARLGIPLAGDMGTESFPLEEQAKRRHGVLISPIPVLSEIVPLQEDFQPFNPFVFHLTLGKVPKSYRGGTRQGKVVV